MKRRQQAEKVRKKAAAIATERKIDVRRKQRKAEEKRKEKLERLEKDPGSLKRELVLSPRRICL